MVTGALQEDKKYDELKKRLQQAEKQAAYYKKLAEQAGIMRLRETEELSKLLTEHKRVQEELTKSEANLRQIIDLVPHMIFVKNREGRFLLANTAVAKGLNTTVAELTGKLHAEMHPNPTEVAQMLEDDRKVMERNQVLKIPEEPFTSFNGQTHWLETIKVPYVAADTAEPAILGVATDITERKRTEQELQQHREHLEEIVEERTVDLIKTMEEARELNEQLQQEIVERKRAEEQIRISLQEKEVLLKEIHHRVKNNLQVISSLLNLQAHLLQDTQAQVIFQESQQRIKLMALIHEKLYRSEDLANIDFNEYLEALVYDLSQSYRSSVRAIQWRIDVTDVHFGIDTAIPCGLIINELISNALKYAFPEGTGTIRIHLSQIPDGHYELIVSDDGIGLSEEFSMECLDSLGLQLVQGLTEEQLNGEFELKSQQGTGTTWRIIFP